MAKLDGVWVGRDNCRAMLGSLDALFAATVMFVGGHFIMSAQPLRHALRERLGENGFVMAYSTLVLLAFLWMVAAYNAAPYQEIWAAPRWLAWVPLIVMPLALFLVIAGLTTPNTTMVYGERIADGGPQDPAPGVTRITRHPFLWGASLWAASHLLVNGDAASLILMGGILILSLGGMVHIDRKREASLGSAWGPIKLTTSLVPFAAIITRRTRFDWRGIGWWRPLLALLAYFALLHLHSLLFGAYPLPF